MHTSTLVYNPCKSINLARRNFQGHSRLPLLCCSGRSLHRVVYFAIFMWNGKKCRSPLLMMRWFSIVVQVNLTAGGQASPGAEAIYPVQRPRPSWPKCTSTLPFQNCPVWRCRWNVTWAIAHFWSTSMAASFTLHMSPYCTYMHALASISRCKNEYVVKHYLCRRQFHIQARSSSGNACSYPTHPPFLIESSNEVNDFIHSTILWMAIKAPD